MDKLKNHSGHHFGVTPKGPAQQLFGVTVRSDGFQLTDVHAAWGNEVNPHLNTHLRAQIAAYLRRLSDRLLDDDAEF